MKFNKITINHLDNPIGFQFDELTIDCEISGNRYPDKLAKKLTISDNKGFVYTTDWLNEPQLSFKPKFQLQSKTRYHVTVLLRAKNQIYQQTAFFETGLLIGFKDSQWIGTNDSVVHGLTLIKRFQTSSTKVEQARLYIAGLGLYEAYLDGQKVGDEFLAPGFTNYHYYTQIATHDVTSLLQDRQEHELKIILGDGWYRGNLGIKEHGGRANQYGNALMACAELDVKNTGQKIQVINTDPTWQAETSVIQHSGIYYGEDLDMTIRPQKVNLKEFKQPAKYLIDRFSLPITAHEQFPVVKKIITPSGAMVLDFGQNMAGWVEFQDHLGRGTKVSMEYGEALQDGELYRGNLRSARATFTYVSDGKQALVRPHFTYFGFRYVKLIGFPAELDLSDFQAHALYSNMPAIGKITTDLPLVNRLFENVQWGQRSNFMDVPTDCPQRDERLGWTGDAAVFAKTASYNMDTFEFNRKFAFDIAVEQSLHQGMVPLYVPSVDETDGGKAVWSDAATIIPWVTFQRSGDTSILKQNFGAMMSWVDWIHDAAKQSHNEFLWLDGDQLGDWLALDTEDIMHLKGKTPDDLIASAYYYLSTQIVAKTAAILQAKHEADFYQMLANKIKEAFIAEFFTAGGRLVTDTQTALALCLRFGLYPQEFRHELTAKLVARIEKNKNHLTTGFVGTPALLPALSENGQHELAVQMFLGEDYPGWLYEVKMGATTIWERWDSIEADGTIAKNGMNSLNHYSTGAVMQWAYEDLVGIKADDGLKIAPGISAKFRHVNGHTKVGQGTAAVDWKILNLAGTEIAVTIDIPFGQIARIYLPRTNEWNVEQKLHHNGDALSAGHYEIHYQPLKPFVNQFDIHTPLNQFNQKTELTKQLAELVPFWDFLNLPGNMEHFGAYSLAQLSEEMRGIGFPILTSKNIKNINQIFADYAVKQVGGNV